MCLIIKIQGYKSGDREVDSLNYQSYHSLSDDNLQSLLGICHRQSLFHLNYNCTNSLIRDFELFSTVYRCATENQTFKYEDS